MTSVSPVSGIKDTCLQVESAPADGVLNGVLNAWYRGDGRYRHSATCSSPQYSADLLIVAPAA